MNVAELDENSPFVQLLARLILYRYNLLKVNVVRTIAWLHLSIAGVSNALAVIYLMIRLSSIPLADTRYMYNAP